MPKKLTKEEFIEKARKIHNDKYDYSKVEYVNTYTKVCIKCPIHGEFLQTPNNHIKGKGCNKCVGKGFTNKEKIDKAKKKHNNKYDYSKSDFSIVKKQTIIICPVHGEFKMDYDHHVNNSCGCPNCSKTKKLTKEEFIERAKEVHGDKYDYSELEYKNLHSYIFPKCKIHGKFKINSQSHLRGCGCQKCSKSTLEKDVNNMLETYNIESLTQVNKLMFEWLNNQSLDFYLPKYNIAIECQGKQHFGEGGWSKKFNFNEQYERDKRKFNLCKENNIKLIYYSNTLPKFEYFDKVYTDLEEIIRLIKKKIKK